MKRENKNLLTQQKIIDSAIIEFGTHSYEKSSMNSVCKIGNISKGIICYYFKDKDELYLVCVAESINKLTHYLEKHLTTSTDTKSDIQQYLRTRQDFFNENPYLSNIFIRALLQPPQHLKAEISKIKTTLDEFNINFYKRILINVTL
jgi:AcrR family transcriptional regulator